MSNIDFSRILYVPILKAKLGEFGAIKESDEDVTDTMMPLFEVPPVTWDYENEAPKKSVESHLNKIVETIGKNMGTKPFFLDFVEQIMSDASVGGNPFSKIHDETLANLSVVPVVAVGRNGEYLNSAKDLASKMGLGVALRVRYDTSEEELAEMSQEYVDHLLSSFNLTPENMDIIIDFGSVFRNNAKALYLASRLVISELPYVEKWRSVILSGSSFPESLGFLGKNSTQRLERTEWLVWSMLNAKKEKIKRMPIYSDYAIAHPSIIDFYDPRYMPLTATIRYTLDKEWLIIRGTNLKQASGGMNFSQFRDLCDELIKQADYYGRDYSASDRYIYDCATDTSTSTGQLTTWRKIGNNHHFKLVYEQLASLTD